ncbi:MAG: phage head morphogenesis protein [Holophagales bacterium]|nr:phage head morphogenesis protein [Holophagales bacterium]MYG29335.1 phage head morphogenesis protein [Holophagales bacterium]MYI81320.1 phage head morphogenesis protein [Holophagales bacterium]
MPDVADFRVAADLPPRRAIEYLESKGYLISWDWREVEQRLHAVAFTVAKATEASVLETIRGAVDHALTEGLTERQFQQELEPALRRAGWWGKQTRIAPDGSEQVVQLGSARRLRTIYRTNMRTARAAARFQSQSANAIARPYWMYVGIEDSRIRPSHLALSGRVFRADDPIWRHIYPPNGWGCRCRVRALTEAQVRMMGLQVYSSAGRLREVDQLVDERTGVYRPGIEYVFEDPPHGAQMVFRPDPGWSEAPVAGAAAADLLAQVRARNPQLFARIGGR